MAWLFQEQHFFHASLLPERAVAVLNLRLIRLANRWDAFWGHNDRAASLKEAFMTSAVLTA
jgi:hypothetical protein